MTPERTQRLLNKIKLQQVLHSIIQPDCYNCGSRDPKMSPFEGNKGRPYGQKCCKRKYEIIWVKKIHPVCYHWKFDGLRYYWNI